MWFMRQDGRWMNTTYLNTSPARNWLFVRTNTKVHLYKLETATYDCITAAIARQTNPCEHSLRLMAEDTQATWRDFNDSAFLPNLSRYFITHYGHSHF